MDKEHGKGESETTDRQTDRVLGCSLSVLESEHHRPTAAQLPVHTGDLYTVRHSCAVTERTRRAGPFTESSAK